MEWKFLFDNVSHKLLWPWCLVGVHRGHPAVCGRRHVPEGRRPAFTLFFFVQLFLRHHGSHVALQGQHGASWWSEGPARTTRCSGQRSGHRLPGRTLGCDGHQAAGCPPLRGGGQWKLRVRSTGCVLSRWQARGSAQNSRRTSHSPSAVISRRILNG